MKFSVKGIKIRRDSCEVLGKTLDLYPHQEQLLRKWGDHNCFIVSTMTGSGKTAAALLPLLESGENAIFIYPTNALLRNQLLSICSILGDWLGLKYFVKGLPEGFFPDLETLKNGQNHAKSYNEADVKIAVIDSEVLEHLARYQKKGEAFLEIASFSPDIILTNPDTLFYLLALRYSRSMEILQRVFSYHLVIDEFHMYTGIELCNLLYMLKFSQELFRAFRNKIFLSATPSREVFQLLEEFFGEICQIELQVSNDGFSAVYDVDVELALYEPFQSIEESEYSLEKKILRKIKKMENELTRLKRMSPDLVPCVIVVNSVIQARVIENLLRENLDLQISSYRGLMSRKSREEDLRKAEVLVGTSAIEVGIDFDCAFLLMETGDASSFIQRFGRAGRHQKGNVIVFCEYFNKKKLEEEIGSKSELEREDFIERILKIFPARDSYAWFTNTKYGILAAKLLSEVFLRKIRQSKAKLEIIEDLSERIREAFTRIVASKHMNRFEIAKYWRTYGESLLKHFSFRSSLPSVDVFDLEELRNGRIPTYSVDIPRLLTRGTPLSNAKKYLADHRKNLKEECVKKILREYCRKPLLLIKSYAYRYRAEGQIVDIDKFDETTINEILINEKGKKKWQIRVCISREKNRINFNRFFQDQPYIVINRKVLEKLDWRIRRFGLQDSRFSDKFVVVGIDALLCKGLAEKIK
jgi:CRISPR-associated helicase Cas3